MYNNLKVDMFLIDPAWLSHVVPLNISTLVKDHDRFSIWPSSFTEAVKSEKSTENALLNYDRFHI